MESHALSTLWRNPGPAPVFGRASVAAPGNERAELLAASWLTNEQHKGALCPSSWSRQLASSMPVVWHEGGHRDRTPHRAMAVLRFVSAGVSFRKQNCGPKKASATMASSPLAVSNRSRHRRSPLPSLSMSASLETHLLLFGPCIDQCIPCEPLLPGGLPSRTFDKCLIPAPLEQLIH